MGVRVGIIAGLVLALVGAQLWVARRPVQARWEWLFKPLASLGFVVLGVFDGWPTTLYGQVMVGGLVLAALGDVLLIPKDPRWFLAGLVSFLLGHVAYAAAFVVRGLDGSATLLAALGLGIVAVPIVRWLWPHVRRAMQGPVAAYMIVISAMVALAWGTYVDVGNGWIVAGAVGFYVSDIAVAKQRFVRASFATRAWGLPLYYAAQLVLAATVE